jgi:hypothetical protein
MFAFAVIVAASVAAAGRSDSFRWFPDRPIAWNEHDDENVLKKPESNDLQDEAMTVTLRDNVANEADRILAARGAVPAQDVNAADEVPCSTWYCARNHLHPMSLKEIAGGPLSDPPVLPFKITKGKDEGAATGFVVTDAKGHKFMLKVDPKGHLGLVTGAEMIGNRLFHAAGYNVAGAHLVEFSRSDLKVAPTATFKLFNVEKRPLTEARVTAQLSEIPRLADDRFRGVAIPWISGQVLGSYDTIGRRESDPNDRILHENRRSLRANWVLFAWLSVLDPGPINTIDSYVEEGGRHFVRHYVFDFSCAFGSATDYAQGPQQDGEYLVEVGRTLRALFSLGFYQRPFQSKDQREEWQRLNTQYPSIGYFPAESFDPDNYRANRRVPPHMRMTARDAYWGAKIVTAISDEQLHAVVATARLPEADAAYVEHALRVRRDIIGRRYLRPLAAVEKPTVSTDGKEICFDDLAIDRGYVSALDARYLVEVLDGYGAPLGSFEQPADGPRACLSIGGAAPVSGYRVVRIRERLSEPEGRGAATIGKASRVHLRWREAEHRFVVVGLERDE